MSKSNRRSRDSDTSTPMNVTRKQFDWSETRPSAAVTEYISAMTGREQTDSHRCRVSTRGVDSLVDSSGGRHLSVSGERAVTRSLSRRTKTYRGSQFQYRPYYSFYGPYTLFCRFFQPLRVVQLLSLSLECCFDGSGRSVGLPQYVSPLDTKCAFAGSDRAVPVVVESIVVDQCRGCAGNP